MATSRLGSLSLMSSRPSMVKRKYSERPSLTTALGFSGRGEAQPPPMPPMPCAAADGHALGLGHGCWRRPVGPACFAARRARRRTAGQLGDLLHQVDVAHHQPRLGVVVKLARVVEHPHVAGDGQLRFVFVGDAHIVGRPSDAAGEVADLDGDLAGDLALDVPLQGIVAARGERGIDQINLVLLVEDAELDRRGVDERIGPGELDAIDAFLDRQQAMLADHGDVFGVVDRQLCPFARGKGDEIHGGACRPGGQKQARRKTELEAIDS